RLISTTRSVRARIESLLIRSGSSYTKITAQFETQKRPHELTCVIDVLIGRTRKLWKLNKIARLPRMVVGLLPSILFAPDYVDTLQRSSAARRDFLDQLIAVRNPEYFERLLRLRYTLQQRQILLEQARAGRRVDLSIYTEQVCKDSAEISWARQQLLQQLTTPAVQIYQSLSSTASPLEFKLQNAAITKAQSIEDWRRAFNQAAHDLTSREVAASRNLVGSHRDDLVINKDNQPLREYGSRGEWRSIVISLMLSSLNYLEHKLGERPLFLLDDIFSELDQEHRKKLLPHLLRQQSIITTADPSEVPDELRKNARIIAINNSEICTNAPVAS
ncbi:MAG: DNA replication and repair protein RecF, partial [Parcubacteria group bacterium]